MENLHDILKNMPKPVVLNVYNCEGCGQKVTVTEMAIAGGPEKGRVERFYLGCKCEDRILAQKAIQNEKKALLNRMKEAFDQNSLINDSLKLATFDNYIPPSQELNQAKQELQQFVNEFSPEKPKSFLLSGSYGTGKSHLSYSTAKALLENGYSTLFLSVPKLLTKIKDTFNGSSKFSEADLLDFVAAVDLLVLDDLGAEYTNLKNQDDNWVWTKLFEVVDSRAGKSTIYTTNLSSVELEHKMGTRNFSRIMFDAEIIKMDGKDYRRKAF